MEKRLYAALQVIPSSPGPGPDPDPSPSAGGGVASPVRQLTYDYAIALIFRKGFAQMLQLTIQAR